VGVKSFLFGAGVVGLVGYVGLASGVISLGSQAIALPNAIEQAVDKPHYDEKTGYHTELGVAKAQAYVAQKAEQENRPASVQIVPYIGNNKDTEIAERIYKALKDSAEFDGKIIWEEEPLAPAKHPSLTIDTIHCTPSSAKYVKQIVNHLNKRYDVKIKELVPRTNQTENKLIFAHWTVASDKKLLTQDELDKAQQLCTLPTQPVASANQANP
jgi:hypothetical protein